VSNSFNSNSGQGSGRNNQKGNYVQNSDEELQVLSSFHQQAQKMKRTYEQQRAKQRTGKVLKIVGIVSIVFALFSGVWLYLYGPKLGNETFKKQGLIKYKASNYKDAAGDFKRASYFMKDPESLYYAADCYFNLKNYQKASLYYKDCIKVDPSFKNKVEDKLCLSLLKLSEEAFEYNKINESNSCLKEAMEICPNYEVFKTPASSVKIAESYLKSLEFQKAIFYANIALLKEPANIGALKIRTEAYCKTGKMGEAVADMKTALKTNPKAVKIFAPIRNQLSEKYLQAASTKIFNGEDSEGLKNLNLALDVWPENPQAYYERGRFYFNQRKDKSQAIRDFDKALQLGPSNELTKKIRDFKLLIKNESIITRTPPGNPSTYSFRTPPYAPTPVAKPTVTVTHRAFNRNNRYRIPTPNPTSALLKPRYLRHYEVLGGTSSELVVQEHSRKGYILSGTAYLPPKRYEGEIKGNRMNLYDEKATSHSFIYRPLDNASVLQVQKDKSSSDSSIFSVRLSCTGRSIVIKNSFIGRRVKAGDSFYALVNPSSNYIDIYLPSSNYQKMRFPMSGSN
jgi:tetratricopeptide (TPR) repeat protein